ncbi:hypothetical protein C0584_02710 [Candidatus Parcubacteria bacterium]|nr:MAG: hypothetical protein C0584_02710 [Candidatus Parcubacteria bacterium]
MKIEIVIVLLASFLYFYIYTQKKILRSFIYTFLVYSVIFFHVAFPSFLKILSLPYEMGISIANSFLVLIFFSGLWLSYLAKREYCIGILKDVRWLRFLHFAGIFVFGLFLAGDTHNAFDERNIIKYFLVIISIFFAWVCSVMTNNIEDIQIDKLSNVDRPLVKGAIPEDHYSKIAWIVLSLSLVYSFLINFTVFFFILVFIGNYFIYSMSPLRLKRVPVFSKLIISSNSLLLVILGFTMNNFVENFPPVLFVFFLVGYTLVLNFIDIKDYEGDKKEGIKTLPVILGQKRGKLVIASFFAALYFSVWFYFKDFPISILFLIIGALQFYFINRKNYNERYVFIIYFISFAIGAYLFIVQ